MHEIGHIIGYVHNGKSPGDSIMSGQNWFEFSQYDLGQCISIGMCSPGLAGQ